MEQELLNQLDNVKSYSEFYNCIYNYCLRRLNLPNETKVKSMYYLVLFSVRIMMKEEDVKTLESRLATIDCHQTSYIVSKKTLLMMEIERILGVKIDISEVDKCDDVNYYINRLWEGYNVRD